MSMLRFNDKTTMFLSFMKVLFTWTEMSMLRIDDKIAYDFTLDQSADAWRRMFRTAATLLVAWQRSSVHWAASGGPRLFSHR